MRKKIVVSGYNVNLQVYVAYASYDPHTTAGGRLVLIPLFHAILRHPAGNTPHSRRERLVYIRIFAIFAFVKDISRGAPTFIRNSKEGGHNLDPAVTALEVWARSVQRVARGKRF